MYVCMYIHTSMRERESQRVSERECVKKEGTSEDLGLLLDAEVFPLEVGVDLLPVDR